MEAAANIYRNIIEESPYPVYLCTGIEMVVSVANAATLKAWGKDSSVIGKPFLEALPEIKDQPFINLLLNVYFTGTTYTTKSDRADFNVNGRIQTFYFDFSYKAVRNEEGKIFGVMCIATDVTELERARQELKLLNEELVVHNIKFADVNEELAVINEELTATNEELIAVNVELQESQHELHLTNMQLIESKELQNIAIEQAQLGLWHIDADTRAFISSPKLKELFGYEPDEEMPYEAAVNQVREDYRERVTKEVDRAIETGKLYNLEYPIVNHRDQTVKWIRATGKLNRSVEGQPSYFSGTVLDVTEQKNDEQRKNDFIGIVSHELKTPLTTLSAHVQMLHGKAVKRNDDFTKNSLENVIKQVKKMTTLINGFLNVSRLESGKIYIDKQRFDMANLVREIEAEIISTVSSHQILFAPVEPTIVFADRDKIGQVISNFISNAVKYSPSGTTIHVACVTVNQTTQISVRDQGIGINKEDINKLFDRYYRVEGKQTLTISGFGIGLYLCAEIVKRHEGNIWVNSEIGNGSIFYFSLPIIE